MSPGPLFSVRTRLLAEVAKWAHQGDERPNLARVLFDGKHMVATDGHRMIVAPCETGIAPLTLDREDCALLAAAQREITNRARDAELAFIGVAIGTVTVRLDARVPACTITLPTRDSDGFPPWEQLFKGLKAETPEPCEYLFEPRYLAAIDPVLEAVDCHGTVRITAWSAVDPRLGDHACGPMLFEGGGIRFLIMPKRA